MYDAIVVGARCAGSPTAMLLARAGHRVLLVDRATFPSDALSTHYIHQPGVAALDRWGMLERVAATGAPPIRRFRFDLGPFALEGAPPPLGDIDAAYSVRRAILDEILLEGAAAAGAEVRTGFAVDELILEHGRVAGIGGRARDGGRVTARARLVIGADGMGSLVARGAGARMYDAQPPLTCAYYTYWRGVEMAGAELYPRAGRMIVASPTNGGEVVTIAFWPNAEFARVRAGLDAAFMAAVDLAPDLAARLRAGERSDRFRGTVRLPNFFRQAAGPGWALVGDAGHHKDPILALGITDAFRDAELLAAAADAGLSGREPLGSALAGYGRRRDELAAAGYASTLQFAALQPPGPELQARFAALRHDQAATDRFFGTIAGTVDPAELLAAA